MALQEEAKALRAQADALEGNTRINEANTLAKISELDENTKRFSAEVKTLSDSVIKLSQSAQESQKNAQGVSQVSSANIASINQAFADNQSLQKAQQETAEVAAVNKNLEQKAKELIAQAAALKASGTTLSADQEAALSGLNSILTDGIDNSNQVKEIQAAVKKVQADQRGFTQLMIQNTWEIIRVLPNLINEAKQQKQEIENLKRQMQR